ncbi:ERF family protein [Micromonosporaceae bacterium B7E4]
MTENLAAALAKVQAQLPSVGKDHTAEVESRTGRSYRYTYADLAAVSKAILPLLGANGLSWITRPTINDGGKFVLAYELLHTSGESRVGEYPLTGGTPQEIGSAITYARRYTLCSVTGVAPEQDDDDAAAASSRQPARDQWDNARPATPQIPPEQARQNILANARAAIANADLDGLVEIEQRISAAYARHQITDQDSNELCDAVIARRLECEAEVLSVPGPQGEQAQMDLR